MFEGDGRVAAGGVLKFKVAGRGGVDAGAVAVALNVTVVSPSGAGYVSVYPCADGRPAQGSNVNFVAGDVAPNAVLSKVDGNGEVCVWSQKATDIVVDVNGYFEAGSGFEALKPARLVETRVGPTEKTVDGLFEAGGRVSAGGVLKFKVAGRGGVDAAAVAVALNVTVVSPSGAGYVSVYPCADGRPAQGSNVNYVTGDIAPNAVLSKVDDNGEVCVWSQKATDLVVDVNGFFVEQFTVAP